MRITQVLDAQMQDQVLGFWNVLGPFIADREDSTLMLNTKFPGEETAIGGDANPNLTFTGSDGRKLDWRGTVKAREDGFVDLHKQLGILNRGVAYVTRDLQSDADTAATLRLSVDWRAIVWVNGKEVFKTLDGKLPPKAFDIPIQLRKGKNSISMKVGAGSQGFGFVATLRPATTEGSAAGARLTAASLYVTQPRFDPYLFTYW